jgi:hypothetical protein
VNLSEVVAFLPFVLKLQKEPRTMGIIMPKVGRAVWVFGFSSLGVGAGGGGVKSSFGA